MFGSMDTLTEFFDKNFDNYTRKDCLSEQNNDTSVCPYRNGVIFTEIMTVIYLLIMNMVFFNLIIAAIK